MTTHHRGFSVPCYKQIKHNRDNWKYNVKFQLPLEKHDGPPGIRLKGPHMM